jgi:hypothetical protein
MTTSATITMRAAVGSVPRPVAVVNCDVDELFVLVVVTGVVELDAWEAVSETAVDEREVPEEGGIDWNGAV